MSAWYYVIDGDPEFLTAEPGDDVQLGRPIDWADAVASLRRHASSLGSNDTLDFDLPGLHVEAEPVDDDGEVRGVAFHVGTTSSPGSSDGMAKLVELMLAVGADLNARAWSDDQQRWLDRDDVERGRRDDPV